MTIDELTRRIKAVAAEYVRDPVRQLDLTIDVLRLLSEWMADDGAQRVKQIKEVLGEPVA